MIRNLSMTGLLFLAAMLFATTAFGQRGNKDDVDDALDDTSPLAGLTFGSYIGMGFSNGWQIEASPGVGYKLADFVIVGGGLSYTYASQYANNVNRDKYTQNLIGPRAYAQFNVFNQIYLMGEYQYLLSTIRFDPEIGDKYVIDDGTESVMLLGGGYSSSFGEGFGFYTEFMFNVLWKRSTATDPTYTQPYSIRIGVFYTL